MKFKRDELLKALQAVEAGLSSKELLTQATSLAFSEGRVITYNGRVSVSYAMPKGWEWEGAVHADETIKLLSKMSGAEVEVTEGEGVLLLNDGKTRIELKVEDAALAHKGVIGEPEKWAKLPEGFWKAVKFASFCASRSLVRPILTYVHVVADRVEATDNHRLIVHKLKAKAPLEMLIPAAVVTEIVDHKCATVGATQGWLHFKNEEGTSFACRTVVSDDVAAEKYPNVSGKTDIKGIRVAFPKEMREGLAKCSDALNANKQAVPFVNIAAKGGTLVITGKGPYATVKERYKIAWKEEADFNIHPDILDDALAVNAECTVGDRCIKMDGGKEGWIHIFAMMMKAPTAEE